jgi:hypothetical protein
MAMSARKTKLPHVIKKLKSKSQGVSKPFRRLEAEDSVSPNYQKSLFTLTTTARSTI